jgi:hypothetical protein
MPANKNVCDCPKPPGGRAVCEPHQLAICRVVNGVTEMECVDPPTGLDSLGAKGRLRLQNWALSRIRGVRRAPLRSMNAGDRQLLAAGVFIGRDGAELVRFRLPKVLREERQRATSISLSSVLSKVELEARRVSREEVRQLATLGAASRLHEVKQELQRLTQMLEQTTSGKQTLGTTAASTGAIAKLPSRRHTTLTEAQRRMITDRMKTYWSQRRREKAPDAKKR